jgi:hypothetical protein
MLWAPRPSDIEWLYTDALPGATLTAYGIGGAEFVLTGGRSAAGITRANKMASFIVRSHANAILGVLRTPLIRGGAMTVGKASGAVAAGAILGAVVGTAIARAGWGESGQEDALDLFTFQVSPRKYLSTLKEGFLS